MRSWGAIAVCALALWASDAGAQDLRGTPRVIDGDTLAIGAARVRLFAIDAPERGQPCRDGGDCGARAAAHLEALIDGRPVTCREEDVDRYGRIVATCFAAGEDINRAMVRDGHALPYVAFSRRYVGDAQVDVGFAPPWTYRREGRTGVTAPVAERIEQTGDDDCGIKGNIASSGARIYHTPGSPSYAATRINEARGERWFCSVEDAVAAGWRAPRR